MERLPEISVVIPVYGGEDCLTELHQRLTGAIEPLAVDYEIVLVEDCGPDNSWEGIKALAAADPRVRGLRFSRNFGQHYGISAGIDVARGDWIVVMDCDLQDRPEEIVRLYKKAKEGWDVVLARRTARKDTLFKKATSRAFYAIFRYFTDLPYDESVGNFRIISRQVADAFRAWKEQLRFFGAVINWLGFRVTAIDVQHDPRFAGQTSYTWSKLIDLAVRNVVAYSDKPLRLAIRVGFALAGLALLSGAFFFIRVLFYGSPVSGWASLIVSLYFLGGIILMFLGVIGLYLGRVFEQVKDRPLYIVREATFSYSQTEDPSSQRTK